jgi:hypothetical protein
MRRANSPIAFTPSLHRESVIVNGAPGVLVRFPARALLGAFTVSHGRIVEIYLIADPDKLRRLPLD